MAKILITPSSESFSDINKLYSLYNEGTLNSSWGQCIDWSAAYCEEMPEDMLELSWILASASSYMEQLGLDTALRLCLQMRTFSLKLVLAQAASDEARHAECFSKYALIKKGKLKECWQFSDDMHHFFEKTEDETELFFSHTFLEMLAMKQFSLFRRCFDRYFLGNLYQRILQDESRHVAFGVEYIKSLKMTDLEKFEDLRRFYKKNRDIMFPDDESIGFVSSVVDAPPPKIKSQFENYEKQFLQRANLT